MFVDVDTSLCSELLQRLLEHVRLHHRGREHRGRHQARPNRLPQAVQSSEADQASPPQCQRQDPPLHLRTVIQGKQC